MQTLKGSILIQLLLLQFFAFGQSKENTVNVLQIKNKIYYKETNELYGDSISVARQDVCYDNPNIFDDESCHRLIIIFLDTAKAKSLSVIDVARDTAIIGCYYSRSGALYSFDSKNNIIGQIRIDSWDLDGIQLDLKIEILFETLDFRGTVITKETVVYEGQQNFVNSKKSSDHIPDR